MYGITSLMLIVLIIISIMTIEGHTARKNDVDLALDEAVDSAITNCKESGKYRINNVDELVNDFNRMILNDINMGKEESYDPNLEIIVSISNVDYEKGLLMLVVEEHYTNPNGTISKTRQEAEYIFEKEKEKEKYTISYCDEGIPIKTYTLEEGEEFIIEEDFGIENFMYWRDVETDQQAIFPKKINKSYIYEAVKI